jgi:acyl carrier protein
MSTSLSEEEIVENLTGFIRERFLQGDDADFDASASLLEWGILTSLNSIILLNHVEKEFGVVVPLERVDMASFKDVRSLAKMLCELREPAV